MQDSSGFKKLLGHRFMLRYCLFSLVPFSAGMLRFGFAWVLLLLVPIAIWLFMRLQDVNQQIQQVDPEVVAEHHRSVPLLKEIILTAVGPGLLTLVFLFVKFERGSP